MATVVVINDYIDSLLGVSGTSVPDATIMAGMEDFVHRLEQYNPIALLDLETEIEISEIPTELHYISPLLAVYENDNKLAKRENKEHIANRYSLLNDMGETANYYLIGNKLYIYPFNTSRSYTMRNITYSVTSGVLTWCDKYNYPLAMYCAWAQLVKSLYADIVEIAGLVDAAITLDTSSFDARMLDDDVELATTELGLIQAHIQASGADNDAIKSRVESTKNLLMEVASMRQQYLEYFGTIAPEENK